ncbi:MAG: hypothetical protein J6A52_00700 [Bacilli bacterium]|nr:hypothetical protein [Bacilli bacterium]
MNKKALICVVAGLLLIMTSYTLYNSKTSKVNTNNTNTELTRDDAISIMNDVITDIIKVYEKPDEVFETTIEEIDGKTLYKINNYSSVINKMFTKRGKNQLEDTVFSNGNFTIEKDDEIYFMMDIPEENRYKTSKITIDNVSIKEDKLSCVATLSNYIENEEGIISYYVIEKNLTIVKDKDNWLVDNFQYNNE